MREEGGCDGKVKKKRKEWKKKTYLATGGAAQ